MRRIPQREWLDEDNGSPEEIASSLRDLRRVNRWFGGISTTTFLLDQAASRCGPGSTELLEVAAGDGYAIQQAALKRSNLRLSITALDRNASHIASDTKLSTVTGDALNLPFPDGSFDLVSCALFLHHLSPDEVVRFIREALRVCRRAVLINDLCRSWVHLFLVYLGLPLFRSRITRHDAIASIRQAYTPEEVRELVGSTPARACEISRRFLYRMAVIAWK